jgi:hypothetical protein
MLWYGASMQDELKIECNLMQSYLVILYVFFECLCIIYM